ncbi:alpha/beta fold hydrolase [Demequina sp. NBRC 110051]|uniref:alpha/beta fold hydrolase n=1 Tax=Demequina sp. NBRC 110051 TaxID=1570340 RepID=UPI0013564BF2|nr:alpha/beta hydrolase [Demequina sp. NBRC 110051]
MAIGTALTPDELAPSAQRAAALTGRACFALRRRGYGASDPRGTQGTEHSSGSLTEDALDAVALLDTCGIEQAVIAGSSYAAAVALRMGAGFPERVAGVIAVEPPPVLSASTAEFRAANRALLVSRDRLGAERAAANFQAGLGGAGCPLPASHAEAFFAADIPALLAARWTDADSTRFAAPLTVISGGETHPWFADEAAVLVATLVHARRTDHVVIPGAGHDVAATYPEQTAAAMARAVERASA